MEFDNASLKTKLSVVTLIASVVSLVLVAAAVFIYELTTFHPRLLERVELDAKTVSTTLAAPLRFVDNLSAEDALGVLSNRRNFEMAIVLTPANEVLASFFSTRINSDSSNLTNSNLTSSNLASSNDANPEEQKKAIQYVKSESQSFTGSRFHQNYMEYTHQIKEGNDLLGILYLKYQIPPLYKRLPDYYIMVVLVMLALMSMSLLIHRGLKHYMTGPIKELSDGMRKMAGRYGGPSVQHNQHDELRLLATAFRGLLAQVEQHQLDLQTANEELIQGSNELEKELEERRQAEKRLTYLARHDVLTGLPNRSAFDLRLEELLDDSRAEDNIHTLLYMDLDQFKVVNDTCGHVAGDHLLRQISELLKQDLRKGDILARLGGDEFGVLLPFCKVEIGEKIAHKLRNTIQDFRFSWEGKTFSIGVSIGLIAIGADSESKESLLSIADALCYTAKDNGRNCVAVYQGKQKGEINRQVEMQWISRITQAMEENRIVLMYQEIKPLDDRIEGLHYEILIRLQEPNGELISPGAFLPAAERYNLMPRLDRHVLVSVFEWLSQNPEHLNSLGLCSINLSGVSIGDEAFQSFIVEMLDKYQITPGKICFEITETMAVQALHKTVSFMEDIKSLGCQFALDDFGSGFSSYAYLKNLPVDYLKIDGAFVKDIVEDPLDLAMVKSINEIGHVMGKKTIAEYVENAEIFSLLTEIGVDYSQGYFIGKPTPLLAKKAPRTTLKQVNNP